jgi:hypothetical protein
MSLTIELDQLNDVIDKAKQRLNAQEDYELCSYLPRKNGTRMHHFSFKKMQNSERGELADLITKHILNAQSPQKLPGEVRKPRVSKRNASIEFSQLDLKKLMSYVRAAGDTDLESKLAEHQDNFKDARKNLLHSVRDGKLCPELWDAYAAACRGKGIEPTLFIG